MRLQYGNLFLDVVKFNSFETRAVHDANQKLLYLHVRVDVTAVFNPYVTASVGGQSRSRDPGQVGDVAAVSIAAMRQSLLTPRQQLTITIGDNTILRSPLTINGQAGACDCNGGPLPLSCDVQSFQGTRSALVRWVVETWVDETANAPGARISHVWSASEDLTEDYRTVINISGRIVLRRDLLTLASLNADSFRRIAVHPIPAGFQRKKLEVTASEDGVALSYQITDEEQQWGLKPEKGIVRLEGNSYTDFDWSSGKFGAAFLGLPRLFTGIQVRLWGVRSLTRTQMYKRLIEVATYFGFNIERHRLTLHASVNVSFPQRYGELTVQKVANGILGGAAYALDRENIEGTDILFRDTSSSLWSTQPIATIAPPDRGTRGSGLVQLLTQALTSPGSSPDAPPTLGLNTASDV